MDSDDHISVDEISDLHSLSKEALVGRIVELIKEKKELWKKFHTSSVAEEQPDRTNAGNLDCEPPVENSSSADLDDGIHAKAVFGHLQVSQRGRGDIFKIVCSSSHIRAMAC